MAGCLFRIAMTEEAAAGRPFRAVALASRTGTMPQRGIRAA